MDIKVIEQESTALVVKAKGMVITTQEENIVAGEFLQSIKAMQGEVKEAFDPIIEKAHAAHKEAITQRDKYLDPLKEAEKIIKGLKTEYVNEVERIAREQQRKLQEEAERKAEAERKRKEEQERQWREKAEKLEAEGRLAEAAKAQEKADLRAMEAEAVQAEVPILAPPEIKVKGESYRDKWSCEVIDINLLPREWMIPNQSALDGLAEKTKGAIQIPGCQFYATKIMSSRSSK